MSPNDHLHKSKVTVYCKGEIQSVLDYKAHSLRQRSGGASWGTQHLRVNNSQQGEGRKEGGTRTQSQGWSWLWEESPGCWSREGQGVEVKGEAAEPREASPCGDLRAMGRSLHLSQGHWGTMDRSHPRRSMASSSEDQSPLLPRGSSPGPFSATLD